jgi:hypothetical protein
MAGFFFAALTAKQRSDRVPAHRFRLIFILLLSLSSCAAAANESATEIRLAPGMKRGENKTVPALLEKVAIATNEVAIEPGKPFEWVAEPKDGGRRFEVTIRTSEAAKRDEIVMTVWDWENRVVHQSKVAGDAKPQTAAFVVEGRGVYLITLDGFRDGTHAYRHIRSFAVVPGNEAARARWKESDYWLGVCAFPGRYVWMSGGKPTTPAEIREQEARDLEAGLMARLGFTVARVDVSMALPEKETVKIDWTRMDAAAGAYTSRGFELALQLMHPPDWSIDPKYKDKAKDRWRYPRLEEPYRRYAKELVTRYGKDAKFVQVNNEPDQGEFWAGEPEEYVTEFGWATDEIRKVLPKTPIANGGYAFIEADRSEFYTKQLKGKADLNAYHSHGNLRELQRDIEHMRRLHKESGYEKPRYVNTECGYAAWRLDQERVQAAVMPQKFLYSWASGDEGMLMFVSRMTKAPGRSGRDFGLLDYDFCPRFVYGTVAGFVDLFAGARFERTLAESEGLHVYAFRRGGQRLVAVFSVGDVKAVTIESDAHSAAIADGMGNREPVMNAGAVNVAAGFFVRTIVLEGATRVGLKE